MTKAGGFILEPLKAAGKAHSESTSESVSGIGGNKPIATSDCDTDPDSDSDSDSDRGETPSGIENGIVPAGEAGDSPI